MTTVEIIITIASLLLGSTGFATVIVACLNRRWSKKDKQNKDVAALEEKIDKLMDAQIVVMLDRICWLGEKYIDASEIRISDLLKIEGYYKEFKNLGGNGDADVIMKKVRALPVVHE